jgi:hypothetical protein
MNPVERAKQIVFGYNENPKEYTDREAEQIAFIAAQLGLPFRPESKALQKFFFDLADNMAFGLLPEDKRPTSRGESVFGETKREKAAGALSLIGLALPGVAGASIAGTGARALTKRLPQATQDAISQSIATRLAGGLGAMNIAEDPMGTPGRALTGALIGGGAIAGRSLLNMSSPSAYASRAASRFRDPFGLSGISNVGIAI